MRRWKALSAIPAAMLVLALSACGNNQESAATPTPDSPTASAAAPSTSQTTAPVHMGVPPGIVVGRCDNGRVVVVSSFAPVTGQEQGVPVQFGDSESDDSLGSCIGLTAWTNGHGTGGYIARSAFNQDFTNMVVSRKDTSNKSTAVGVIDVTGHYTQLSPVASDFTNQADEDPTLHRATGRVYYWDNASEPKLMSCDLAGGGTKVEAEGAAAQKYNHDGVYAVGTQPLILADGKQIYLAKLAGGAVKITTLLRNDKMKTWDATPSPDGKTVAFLSQIPDGTTTLYSVPTDGSGATAPTALQFTHPGGSVAILEFS